MIGVFLSFCGSLFEEISSSIGKKEVSLKQEDVYAMGFINMFLLALIYAVIVFIVRQQFLFSFESWPTFTARAILEIAQAHCTYIALTKTDRSTFGFVRILTLPLLLLIDIILGYYLPMIQIIGMALIIITIGLLFFRKEINKQGIGWTVFVSINAVATISLFKFNITHYNSIETEQFLVCLILVIYFFFLVLIRDKTNPFKLLKRPVLLAQSLTQSGGALLDNFAYGFAPASIITTAKRSGAIIWSTVAGRVYFHEKHIIFKISVLVLLISGLIFLVV